MLLTLGYGLGSFLCFLCLLPNLLLNRLSNHQNQQNELEGMLLLYLLLDLDMEQVIKLGGMQV
jgi:hypothetical protein